MKKIFSTIVFVTVILTACSLGNIPPQPPPVSTTQAASPLPPTALTPLTSEISSLTPDPNNCGYQWAQQDLPELSASFQESIQGLEPNAQASAYAFGENCVLSDGTIARFLAMETDFNVALPVDDLANEAVLGRWIVNVMDVIQSIPAEQIVGPRPGRVSIVFQSGTAQSVLNFYIDQYQALPDGLSHTEIYEALLTPQ
jgi:hypothetical protein